MAESSGPRGNRRLTARTTCQLKVRYRLAEVWRPATVMDLSRYGCRLRLGEDLPRGEPISLTLESPRTGGAELPITGTVIWSRREGLSYQVGIHFPEVPAGLEAFLDLIH
jgi:hypothetical protein